MTLTPDISLHRTNRRRCAIQFAKMRGARVITTVSGPEKAAHARSAGADEVINYRTENVGQRVKTLTNGHGVDAVIELDLSTNGKDYSNILRPHATVVVYGMSSNESTLPTLWLMRNSITLRLPARNGHEPWAAQGGRLRVSGTDIEDYAAEVPPDGGLLFCFRVQARQNLGANQKNA